MGAAALLLVGVSLLLGLEWMRPDEKTTNVPAPAVAPEVPASAPTQDARPAPAPDLGPVPVALNDEESVPAIVTPPEPVLRPAATTGTRLPEIAARPVAIREMSPPIAQRTLERRPAEEPPTNGPVGEVSDEFVATPRNAATANDAGPAIVPPSAPADTPVTAEARVRVSPPADAVTSAATVPSVADHGRVEEVLRRYARAYGQLDAGAARAVWPTVDERALARAFQNLSSQKVTFSACDIDIRGVTANASCRGEASYAPKVGNREPRTDAFTWRFELRRDGDAWKIEGVDARRQSTVAYRE